MRARRATVRDGGCERCVAARGRGRRRVRRADARRARSTSTPAATSLLDWSPRLDGIGGAGVRLGVGPAGARPASGSASGAALVADGAGATCRRARRAETWAARRTPARLHLAPRLSLALEARRTPDSPTRGTAGCSATSARPPSRRGLGGSVMRGPWPRGATGDARRRRGTTMDRSSCRGDEAVAAAALDAGVHLGTGYPGTPSTEILETFTAPRRARPVGAQREGGARGRPRRGLRRRAGARHDEARRRERRGRPALHGRLHRRHRRARPRLRRRSRAWPRRRTSRTTGTTRWRPALPMLEPSDSQEAYDLALARLRALRALADPGHPPDDDPRLPRKSIVRPARRGRRRRRPRSCATSSAG